MVSPELPETVYACIRCGVPVAVEYQRCPICGTWIGSAQPSPFSGRWWAIYAAVFGALLLMAFVVTLIRN